MSLMRHGARGAGVERDWPAMGPPWRWFDEAFRDVHGHQLIKVEEFTEDGTLVVRAELPGIDPDKDVDITIDNRVLHITAERRQEEDKSGRFFHHREFRYGSFSRRVELPEGADESSVDASYKDGVLEVRVPLPAEAAKEPARRIQIARG